MYNLYTKDMEFIKTIHRRDDKLWKSDTKDKDTFRKCWYGEYDYDADEYIILTDAINFDADKLELL